MVGRYELLREVGRGGTAVVYVARQLDLGREVALKELAAFHAARPEVVERFLRESRVTSALNHPNVVTVHEYLEHEGTAFIAMEYFERGSLRPWVRRLSVPQVVGVLEGVLAGLAHAEAHGIVHRDLKPENLMVTSAGGIKITDFGIAKALQASGGRPLTAEGTTVGTPAYMAPEQALGTGVGPWTDLYAVGVMAYELLSGDVPFPEDESPLVTLLRHANEAVAPLHEVAPSTPRPLCDWVRRMLAKQPEERPAGAAKAWEELEEAVIDVVGSRWRRDARLVGDPADLPERATSTLQTVAMDGSERATEVVGRRRHVRRRVAGAAIALAVVAAGVVALVLGTRGPASPPRAGAGGSIPDFVPAASERLSLAVAGPSLVVADPRGRVVVADRSSLEMQRVLRDPAGPLAVAVSRARVYVADGEGVTSHRAATLAPVSVVPFADATALSAGGQLVVATRGGRVCELAGRVPICGRVGFAPSGLGASGALVFAADGKGGSVAILRRDGHRLVVSGKAVRVARPHGQLAFFGGRLYVPSQRGIAVVDLPHRSVRMLRLPVSPAAIWIAKTGRLYAALPATGQVAIVATRTPSRRPAYVRVGGRPVALAGAGGTVFVAERSGRITKLDAGTGARGRSAQVLPRVAPPGRATLRRLSDVTSGDTTTLRLTVRGGRLDVTSIRVRDGAIADGHATIELWQGGIATAVRARTFGDLAARVTRQTGRLAVRLTAPPGAFVRLRARLTGNGVAVDLMRPTATAPPPFVPSPPPASPPVSPPPPPPAQPRQKTTGDTCCNVG
ncbi:MAG TPA: protein kinase [Gaiellaceae bacterium]